MVISESDLKKRKLIVNLIFWIPILILAFIAFGPNLRFGPDFRLNVKVIHPEESGFDPQAFQFEDYNTYHDSVYVLSKIFPSGTPRKEMESILVRQKNFIRSFPPIREPNGLNSYGYEFKRPYFFTGWHCLGPSKADGFAAYFDEQDRLVEFYIRSCGLWNPKTIDRK